MDRSIQPRRQVVGAGEGGRHVVVHTIDPFRVPSFRDTNSRTYISATEDLEGVFEIE